jgi:hypothetical protein
LTHEIFRAGPELRATPPKRIALQVPKLFPTQRHRLHPRTQPVGLKKGQQDRDHGSEDSNTNQCRHHEFRIEYKPYELVHACLFPVNA